ncbi:MbnP family copper-binding protein [Hydrocarboniphaga sp.]|uniref:MbnP family copper-binding protein n=1 Tax=Hydrocarboniphaga sp. TaxID=2033016 RepID=UPI003D143EDC
MKKSIRQTALVACTTLGLTLLTACCSGSSDEGIEASITATPLGAATHHHDETASRIRVPAHSGESEYVSFRRSDGVKIDLQLGLLNLVPIELQSCGTTVGLLMQRFARELSPIASAYAHGGDGGDAPEGAISVVEGETTDLGALTARPGRYCGIVVELQPGQATPASDSGLDTSLEGAAINVAPCYYATAAGLSDEAAAAVTTHSCIQAKYSGDKRRVTLPFTTPVTLDAASRELAISIAVRYEEWFENVDFTKLATDAAEQARLADNVAGSLQALTGDEQLVNLAFKIAVNGEEAVCGQVYDGLGNGAQRDLRVEGFRYYASDFELENAAGTQPVRLASKPNATVYQDDRHGVALLGQAQGCDAPAQVRNLSLAGAVKKDDYERLCFLLGVPFELGHSDPATAPSPLNVTGMDWSWLFGRMFFRFDSIVDPDGDAPANFFVHLGSTGCSNGSSDFGAAPSEECVFPNRPRICLDYAEIEEGHPIVADIAPMISEVDIGHNTEDTAPGCMSFTGDPECVTVIPKFGLDYQLDPASLVPRREQALFSVGE